MKRIRILYDDRSDDLDESEWEGRGEDRVLKVTIAHPRLTDRITAVGWDRYAFAVVDAGFIFGVFDVDPGSVNPGRGIVALFRRDGGQVWRPMDSEARQRLADVGAVVKRGVWVSDERARELGLIL